MKAVSAPDKGLNSGQTWSNRKLSGVHAGGGPQLSDPARRLPGVSVGSTACAVGVSVLTLA